MGAPESKDSLDEGVDVPSIFRNPMTLNTHRRTNEDFSRRDWRCLIRSDDIDKTKQSNPAIFVLPLI